MKELIIFKEDAEKIISGEKNFFASHLMVDKGDEVKISEVEILDYSKHFKATGKIYYATVLYVEDFCDREDETFWIVSIKLAPYMDANGERFQLTGHYDAETVEIMEGEKRGFTIRMHTSKPAWIYNGKKWMGELSLSELRYEALEAGRHIQDDFVPDVVRIKFQGKVKEETYEYKRMYHGI